MPGQSEPPLASLEAAVVLAVRLELLLQRLAVVLVVLEESRRSQAALTPVAVAVALRTGQTSQREALEAAVRAVQQAGRLPVVLALQTPAVAAAVAQPTSRVETAALESSCFAFLLQCPSQPAPD
jgi:hypothetical protein